MKDQFPGDQTAKLNIGHSVGDKPEVMNKKSVSTALAKVGAEVADHKVVTPSEKTPNLSERTSVVTLKKPLSELQGQALARETGQKSIAQNTGTNRGNMFVQPEHAADAAKEGWNEFNPDYFHHGDGSTESERSKAAGVEKHLTPEEREQTARGGAIQSVVKAFHEDLPAHFTDELASMGLAGAAKRGWYKQAGKAITAFHGPDAPRFTAVLAAQSPRLPVGRNFTNAMHLFDAWDRAGDHRTMPRF